MPSPDRLIASCRSWDEFWDRTRKLSNVDKGIAFERLTQLYLQTAPEYRTELAHVWLLRDVPADIRRRLNLPGPADEGIDLIARTRRGEYWAIQAKFRSERDKPLSRQALGTFTSLAFNTCNDIALAVVAHTAAKPVSKRHLMRNTVEIGLDRWQSLDREAWALIVGRLRDRRVRPKARSPRPHQRAAISAAKAHFIRGKSARGRLIMPCGTGKSLASYWIAEALGARIIVVAVPSLALIRQSVADWTREFLAHGHVPDWICVCSDETVGKLERDEFVGEVYELGLPTHTNPKEIATLLRVPSKGSKIVFTTYQSSDKVAAAARKARIRFDLAILDEAHKTVGTRSKQFATLLHAKKINVRRRLFMTATERVLRGKSDDVLSMDNEHDYGKCFFHLSYKEAIKRRIISDYKVLTMTVSDYRIRRLIAENRILNLSARNLDEAEAQSAAAGIALKRVFKKHGIKHAISFHRSIRSADRFREQQDAFNRLRDIGPATVNLHISSKKTAGERSDLLREFVEHKRSLITNARCLTEGIDVPETDCVLFADPKQSRIDIVQAAGRALRRYSGKEYGYILLPLVVPGKMKFGDFAETTAFRQVARTITALSTQDERIADEFRAIEKGRISSGKIVEIEGDVSVGMKIALSDFAGAISTRIWESVGRANWRGFEDACGFVSSLGLKSKNDWEDYCKSGKKPADIPASPEYVYAKSGWHGWSDWLGTGRRRRGIGWRPFNDARAFVHRLGLKSEHEWRDYCKSGNKPADIPAVPGDTYVEVGWVGMGDWLGTGFVATSLRQHRPFKKARTFVHGLGLKSQTAWRDYCLSGKKPPDIPANPNSVYPEAGWTGWGDWLGTGRIADQLREYRSFTKARLFVRRLKLKSETEWRDYCKFSKKPADIPASPGKTYAKKGWAGMGDWLGTGRRRGAGWRPFKEARAFVRRLKLKSQSEWRDYCKSRKKPAEIPANPDNVYAEVGWNGWSDWLGNGRHRRDIGWRPFKEARTFVRRLGLKSGAEWNRYCKSGKKFADIPAAPRSVYGEVGWASMGDWLGTGTVALYLRQYRSFKKARAFVRRLGLKSSSEWRDYCKSGKKPANIPAGSDRTYAKKGWAGAGDWLGTGTVATHLRPHRSFKKARAFVRQLGLKSFGEWRNYCKSGKKPAEIPAGPNRTYAKKGWAGWGDWLGTGTIAHRYRQWRSFNKARAFVRGLGLKSHVGWDDYCKSGRKPGDIPVTPNRVYARTGWSGWGDWHGTSRGVNQLRQHNLSKQPAHLLAVSV
jgi:superfamily II DNA or RNA helicase